MKNLEHLFPSMPSYRGYWHSILLEPIIGSGEKITVIIVAVGNDSAFKIHKTLNSDVLKCLYGNNAYKIENIIHFLAESIQNELTSRGHLESWESPFQGVELRDKSDAASANLDGILNQGILFSSSFAKASLNHAKKSPKKQKWANNIINQVKTHPVLKSFINKKILVNDVKIKYHFLTEKYVANFGQLSVEKNDVAEKIYDLEILKKINSEKDNYEIIIETSNCLPKHIQLFKDIASDNGIGVIETTHEKENEIIHYLLQKVA